MADSDCNTGLSGETTTTDTGLEPNASAAATPTIPLTTDADFLAAEAELERLMALHDDANDDEVGDALAAQWRPIQHALLDAAPSSPLQAAVILRRLTCPRVGLKRGAPKDHHEGTIKRVIGFLVNDERPPSIRHTGLHAVIEMETPIRDIRAVSETLYALSTTEVFPDAEGMQLVLGMLSDRLHDRIEAIKSIFDHAVAMARTTGGEA